jgi:hypothetical protein
MEKQLYLFSYDYGTGGLWYYFRAYKPNDVRRKYPFLVYVEQEPAWLTAKIKESLLARSSFDVDDLPSSSPTLTNLKAQADQYFASLGEQVLPPSLD